MRCSGRGAKIDGANALGPGDAKVDAVFSGPHPDSNMASTMAETEQARLSARIAMMRFNRRGNNTTPKRRRHYADDKLCHGDIAHFRSVDAVITRP
ncbi:MAG TPA: hypothetical protein VN753_09555 [Terracidiphilus sp.]|nr:hypothetical protein [Terracidiphilus sp.]